MTALSKISTWPEKRWPWLLLFLSATTLELIALYFQYAMALEPCVMCIYQRVAVFGVLFSSVPALIAPNNMYFRLVSYVGWLTSAFWGAKIAYEHVLMQNPDNFLLAMSCDVFPNFPSWFAIHQWLPAIFEPRGTCDSIDWVFASLSMPEWMLVTFIFYALTAVSVLLIKLIKTKTL